MRLRPGIERSGLDAARHGQAKQILTGSVRLGNRYPDGYLMAAAAKPYLALAAHTP